MLDMTYEEYIGEPFRMWHNGIDYSDYFVVLEVTGRSLSPNEIQSLSVSGMPGSYFQGKRKPGVPLKVKVILRKNSSAELRTAIDDLNGMLDTDEPVPIEFSDEPNKTYYGILSDISEGVEVEGTHIVTITFWRGDPYKYGPERTLPIPDTAIIENQGTAEADPIFTMQVKEPTTFAMVSSGEEYMMVGQPVDVTNNPPFRKYERIFYSDASSTVGWTDGTDVDGGVVAGTMQSNGTRFEAVNYGTGTLWHGPAIKRSMPEVVSDFRFQAFVALFNQNVAAYVGRIEIYLLDTVGNTVAKLAIKDTQSAQSLGFAEIRAGDMNNNHFLINEYGDRPGNWNNFNGILRVEREGNEWYAYVAMVDTTTGRHHTRRSVRWIDTNNRFTRNVAQVQVHVGQFGSHQTTAGGVYSMTLEKINQETNGVPYIADAGDEIVFDHVTGDAYINGESVPFDFGADFFKLKKGQNALAVLPENTFETSVKFRERNR